MPNCDWGRPCDCIECRTIYDHITCPKCGFPNVVRIVRIVEGYSVDHDNIGGYNFSIPKGNGPDLSCYKCHYQIQSPPYYDEIDIDGCKREIKREQKIKDGRICSKCGFIEEFNDSGLNNQVLQEKNGKLYCRSCFIKRIKQEKADPSNEKEKYVFNEEELKWKLDKVRIICPLCGRKRWLLERNKFKQYCLSCYKKISNQ